MASVRLSVSGMHCGHCQDRVERALRAVPGVYAAAVDLPGGAAEVDFDERSTGPEQLIDAVRAAGYTAAPA